MSERTEVPPHYRRTVRRLVRFAAVGIGVGLLLGLGWTELRKQVRYGLAPGAVAASDPTAGRARLELPAGLMFEAGLDLKLAHGHAILIAGLLPLCFAAALHLTRVSGGREVGPGALAWFTWLYLPGASVALALMVYKGCAQFLAIRAAALAGAAPDLAALDRGLFLGSRALRGACYGLSHSAMAIGAFVLLYALWRAAGGIEDEPARP